MIAPGSCVQCLLPATRHSPLATHHSPLATVFLQTVFLRAVSLLLTGTRDGTEAATRLAAQTPPPTRRRLSHHSHPATPAACRAAAAAAHARRVPLLAAALLAVLARGRARHASGGAHTSTQLSKGYVATGDRSPLTTHHSPLIPYWFPTCPTHCSLLTTCRYTLQAPLTAGQVRRGFELGFRQLRGDNAAAASAPLLARQEVSRK